MNRKITFREGAADRLLWGIILMFYGGVFAGCAGVYRDWKGYNRDAYASFFIGIGLSVIGLIILFTFLYRLSEKDIEIDSAPDKQPMP